MPDTQAVHRALIDSGLTTAQADAITDAVSGLMAEARMLDTLDVHSNLIDSGLTVAQADAITDAVRQAAAGKGNPDWLTDRLVSGRRKLVVVFMTLLTMLAAWAMWLITTRLMWLTP